MPIGLAEVVMESSGDEGRLIDIGK